MDYQTKILLGQLVVTFASVVASTVISILLFQSNKKIGDRQNELIEEQNRLTRNKLLGELYDKIIAIHQSSENFLYYIGLMLWHEDIKWIDKLSHEIDELQKELNSASIVRNLQFVGIEKSELMLLLCMAHAILWSVDEFKRQGTVVNSVCVERNGPISRMDETCIMGTKLTADQRHVNIDILIKDMKSFAAQKYKIFNEDIKIKTLLENGEIVIPIK